ncbi:MAG: hypothetical protein Q8Q08_00655 [Candidatus Omnitrophota bacterium]|nr:hypothetical protein [Candidatus Omnitrophota bacterium]MDZ4243144.1 hypothetical protein [Candidatus Omnitrophota bacterium]
MPLKFIKAAGLVYFLGILVVHGMAACKEFPEARRKALLPLKEPGLEYADLRPFLSKDKRVGYATDRDLSPENNNTYYLLSAQYMLAPVVLEIEDGSQDTVLLDYTHPDGAFEAIWRLGLTPIHDNRYGKLLARRP